MKYLLTILFLNLFNEPVMLDGWHPIELDTLEKCETAKVNVENYLDTLKMKNYTVTCELILEE